MFRRWKMNIKVKNLKTGEEKQFNHKIWVKKLIKKGRIRPEEREKYYENPSELVERLNIFKKIEFLEYIIVK
jgi:hypothetical protein